MKEVRIENEKEEEEEVSIGSLPRRRLLQRMFDVEWEVRGVME